MSILLKSADSSYWHFWLGEEAEVGDLHLSTPLAQGCWNHLLLCAKAHVTHVGLWPQDLGTWYNYWCLMNYCMPGGPWQESAHELAHSKCKVNHIIWDLRESRRVPWICAGVKMCEESVIILLKPSDVEWSKLLLGSLTLNDSWVRWGGLLDRAVDALAKKIPDQNRRFNESPCEILVFCLTYSWLL